MRGEIEDWLSPKKKAKISIDTRRLIRYHHLAKMGLKINYEEFSPQELRDLEYIFLRTEQEKTKNNFEVLFTGFSQLFKKILQSFKRK